MAGSSFWANAQAQIVVAWYYQEWSITQDSLNYKYNTGTNQLQYITDNVANNVSTTDIDNQSPNNYIYDKSGNMVADNSQLMSVSWSPYGKILTNTKAGKIGEVVTQEDFNIKIADNMIASAGKSVGTTFFVMALGGDDHSAIVSLTVNIDGSQTFNLYDQLRNSATGSNRTPQQFDDDVSTFLFRNSSSPVDKYKYGKKDPRFYNPSTKINPNGNIPKGNVEVTATQVIK